MFIKHRFKLAHLVTAFFAVLFLAGATASFAQTYTLTIRSGEVYINGKAVPKNELPASLNSKTLDANLSFTGPSSPTFELDGHYYKIENNKLLDVTAVQSPVNRADNDRTTVIFRDAAPAARQRAAESEASAEGNSYRSYYFSKEGVDGDPNVVMQQYVFELKQNAEELNEMSASLSQRQARDLIQQVQYQAEQAAQLAQELPYLEMQNYVRQSDELLYQRLVSELELERETQRIAAEVRRLPGGEQRDFKIEELREMLANILELKQENRQMEIDQLEKQLALLKQRFAEREAMKERMIDRRLKELVGEH